MTPPSAGPTTEVSAAEVSAAEVRELNELITPGPAEALAGLLGVPLAHGELPLLWHWVYLLDRPPQAILGADGHPARDAIPSPPGPGRPGTDRARFATRARFAIRPAAGR